MKHFKKAKKPTILTVNGKANALEGIRQGLEDVKKGRMRPARRTLEMFRRKHGIPG